jgi:hypothetical protein
MSAATVLRNVAPASLAEIAGTQDFTRFLLQYGNSLVLAVRVGEDDPQLASGLDGPSGGPAGRASAPGIRSMEFHTASQAAPRHFLRRATDVRGAAGAELVQRLSSRLQEGRHVIVPLRQRADSETLSAERISVGRATNKDIVLRHSSVSKFHAWFETDANDVAFVTDAESKNATRVNGKALSPRERTHVEPGDVIIFGTVDTVLCSPDTLWAVLTGRGPTHMSG